MCNYTVSIIGLGFCKQNNGLVLNRPVLLRKTRPKTRHMFQLTGILGFEALRRPCSDFCWSIQEGKTGRVQVQVPGKEVSTLRYAVGTSVMFDQSGFGQKCKSEMEHWGHWTVFVFSKVAIDCFR